MMKIRKVLCFLVVITVAAIELLCAVPVSAGATSGTAGGNGNWVGTWSTSPIKMGVTLGSVRVCDFLNNTSLRSVVQCTVGGDNVRIKFSNKYGAQNITINETNIARTSDKKESAVVAGSSIPLTFSGKQTAVIPAGSYIYSDPVKMTVQALEYLSISYYVEKFTYMPTGGLYGATTYVESGNKIGNADFSSATPLLFTAGSITYHTVPFLCNVDVTNSSAYSVVFFGDSTITNQAPYFLAERLKISGVNNVGVLQQAIIANRVLYDGDGVSIIGNIYGEAAIKRFRDDVVNQAGVKAVFVKIGVNDIIHPRTTSMAGKAPLATTDEIIAGYKNLITQAKNAGIKIYFFARTPWKGYSRNFGLTPSDVPDVVWTQQANDMSTVLNQWLRYSSGCDGFIDLSVLDDPYDNTKLRAEYTTDGAHLTDVGARLLADAVPAYCFGISSSAFKSVSALYRDGLGGKRVMTPVNASTGAVKTTVKATSQALTQSSTVAGGTTAATTAAVQSPATTVPVSSALYPTVLVPAGTDAYGNAVTETPPSDFGQITPAETTVLVPPVPEAEMSAGTKAAVALITVLTFAAVVALAVFLIRKRNEPDAEKNKVTDKKTNSDGTVEPHEDKVSEPDAYKVSEPDAYKVSEPDAYKVSEPQEPIGD